VLVYNALSADLKSADRFETIIPQSKLLFTPELSYYYRKVYADFLQTGFVMRYALKNTSMDLSKVLRRIRATNEKRTITVANLEKNLKYVRIIAQIMDAGLFYRELVFATDHLTKSAKLLTLITKRATDYDISESSITYNVRDVRGTYDMRGSMYTTSTTTATESKNYEYIFRYGYFGNTKEWRFMTELMYLICTKNVLGLSSRIISNIISKLQGHKNARHLQAIFSELGISKQITTVMKLHKNYLEFVSKTQQNTCGHIAVMKKRRIKELAELYIEEFAEFKANKKAFAQYTTELLECKECHMDACCPHLLCKAFYGEEETHRLYAGRITDRIIVDRGENRVFCKVCGERLYKIDYFRFYTYIENMNVLSKTRSKLFFDQFFETIGFEDPSSLRGFSLKKTLYVMIAINILKFYPKEVVYLKKNTNIEFIINVIIVTVTPVLTEYYEDIAKNKLLGKSFKYYRIYMLCYLYCFISMMILAIIYPENIRLFSIVIPKSITTSLFNSRERKLSVFYTVALKDIQKVFARMNAEFLKVTESSQQQILGKLRLNVSSIEKQTGNILQELLPKYLEEYKYTGSLESVSYSYNVVDVIEDNLFYRYIFLVNRLFYGKEFTPAIFLRLEQSALQEALMEKRDLTKKNKRISNRNVTSTAEVSSRADGKGVIDLSTVVLPNLVIGGSSTSSSTGTDNSNSTGTGTGNIHTTVHNEFLSRLALYRGGRDRDSKLIVPNRDSFTSARVNTSKLSKLSIELVRNFCQNTIVRDMLRDNEGFQRMCEQVIKLPESISTKRESHLVSGVNGSRDSLKMRIDVPDDRVAGLLLYNSTFYDYGLNPPKICSAPNIKERSEHTIKENALISQSYTERFNVDTEEQKKITEEVIEERKDLYKLIAGNLDKRALREAFDTPFFSEVSMLARVTSIVVYFRARLAQKDLYVVPPTSANQDEIATLKKLFVSVVPLDKIYNSLIQLRAEMYGTNESGQSSQSGDTEAKTALLLYRFLGKIRTTSSGFYQHLIDSLVEEINNFVVNEDIISIFKLIKLVDTGIESSESQRLDDLGYIPKDVVNEKDFVDGDEEYNVDSNAFNTERIDKGYDANEILVEDGIVYDADGDDSNMKEFDDRE
jgi:hypothetical protein